MNRIASNLLLTLALTVAAAPALAQGDPQVINIPLTRPGDPITLDIGILSARIEVIGEDRDDAEIQIAVAGSERRIVTPSGTKTLSGGSFSFEVDERDNEISVDTDWRADKAHVVARIPKRADLELSTTNDGEIIVSNITGKLELSNTNGPITASGITGSVLANSVNDTIDVGFISIADDEATALETINGNLIVRMPANTAAELHLDSAAGEITSDFEVDVKPSKPTIERDEGRGGVEVRIQSVIVADINGGGPVIRLKSLQGDISIRKTQ